MVDVEQERAALAKADRHIAEAEQRITEQENRITELDRDGHDVASARELLKMLRAILHEFESIGRSFRSR